MRGLRVFVTIKSTQNGIFYRYLRLCISLSLFYTIVWSSVFFIFNAIFITFTFTLRTHPETLSFLIVVQMIFNFKFFLLSLSRSIALLCFAFHIHHHFCCERKLWWFTKHEISIYIPSIYYMYYNLIYVCALKNYDSAFWYDNTANGKSEERKQASKREKNMIYSYPLEMI